MFPRWLRDQTSRTDDVGRFALLVVADRRFPHRSSKLHKILAYCGQHPELRRLAKKAHAEWRVVRKAGAAS